MSSKIKTAISPTRSEDYSEWYQQVIKAADLAENSPVRGCMVIKPWGYGIWENMQRIFNGMFKATGHRNAYFPLFIPLRFLEKEAKHVEGFAKECAVVTHHRLEEGPDKKLVPASPLQEPLVIRPTSETIIGEMFAKWINSYRDLPLLINQWANVVRWEMRTRLFLRTTEFLWQEGHTCHATAEEAREETFQMLDIYAQFAEKYMAMPVIKGEKTESERFPGAVATYAIEAMMQDRKALQSGTSHFLGQSFAKAANIKFLNSNGQEEFVWTTSWGVSTRLIGALIMAHSDDDGLVLPPKLAPAQVVILPVIPNDEVKEEILSYCQELSSELQNVFYNNHPVAVEVDDRDLRGGEKFWSWVKKGVPIRVEIGPNELENKSITFSRRDKEHKQRMTKSRDEFIATVVSELNDMNESLFQKAFDFRAKHLAKIDTQKDFYEFFTPENSEKPEIHGGFALSHWSGDSDVEEQVKNELNVTIRCIPIDGDDEEGKCVISGKPSRKRVIFAKAY